MFKIFASKKSKDEENKQNTIALAVKEKSQNFSNFVNEKIKLATEEFTTIRQKCSNLLETNYQLGLRHLENGNLSEAIFRFRFINKFWPEHLDSYYQLAYCLIVADKYDEAKKVLENLVSKSPEYEQKAKELLGIATISSEKSDSSATAAIENNQKV